MRGVDTEKDVSTTNAGSPPLAAVFGGGGLFGIAYAFGIVDALAEAGVQLRGAELLGTSAGSWVASCIAGGVPYDAIRALPAMTVPSLKPGLLRSASHQLLGDASSPLVRVGAVRLATGRRDILSGAEDPLCDLVAASSSVPLLFAPARLHGRLYVDGGVRSMVSADRAAAARHLLVVAPIAGPMFGGAGRAMEVVLRHELAVWRQTSGGEVHVIRPNHAIAALARHPLELFDRQRAEIVYSLAKRQAYRILEERPDLAKISATRLTAAA